MAEWKYNSLDTNFNLGGRQYSGSHLCHLTSDGCLRFTLHMRLQLPNGWSGRRGEEKFCPCWQSNPGHPDLILAITLTDMLWINLTLNLLTTTIVAPPSNASKWQMGFKSTFKGFKIETGCLMWEMSEVMIFTFASAQNILKIGLLFLRNKKPTPRTLGGDKANRKSKAYPRTGHEDPERK